MPDEPLSYRVEHDLVEAISGLCDGEGEYFYKLTAEHLIRDAEEDQDPVPGVAYVFPGDQGAMRMDEPDFGEEAPYAEPWREVFLVQVSPLVAPGEEPSKLLRRAAQDIWRAVSSNPKRDFQKSGSCLAAATHVVARTYLANASPPTAYIAIAVDYQAQL